MIYNDFTRLTSLYIKVDVVFLTSPLKSSQVS